jgi:hypothetical protein
MKNRTSYFLKKSNINMKKYIAKYEAIIDLHERGYCEDFQLVGNDLVWLQGKKLIRAGDFSISEYHIFFDSKPLRTSLIIFGVVAFYHDIKGILIHHYKRYPFSIAPVIRKKLNDISVRAQEVKFCKSLIDN